MHTTTRRKLLQVVVETALAAGLPAAGRASTPVTVGYISPATGFLSAFGEADSYVVAALQQELEIAGITLELRDSRSDPSHAASVANELININVALVLVSATPETTNPVSDQCELAGIPCISTVAPWQDWFFGRGGDPSTGFTYTYHFYWGLEDIIAAYTAMWNQLSTNKTVGGLYPNDVDGNAWGDPQRGFPPALSAQNFKLIDAGQFSVLTPDFSAQIGAIKSAGADIVTGVLIPPDFITFWGQAKSQGLAPKVVTIGKALLFPEILSALGNTGNNLSTEVAWTPEYPYSSSLTKQTASQLAAAYTQTTGKQWNQTLGFAHALCELAVDILGRAVDRGNPSDVLTALVNTNLKTIAGPISWANGPVKNVCKTPLVGGQWRSTPGAQNKYELVITETAGSQDIPVGGRMEEMG